MADPTGEIFSATYSNVPVYELKLPGNEHVMRRRSDDWVNATHVLKIAGFDKPARTRILEREVQKGVHEKIQGGYGKYQGTWIPLNDARSLAEKNNIIQRVSKIFDYTPGDRSPPPAPKHTSAATGRQKAPKAAPNPPRQTQHQHQHQLQHQHHQPVQQRVTVYPDPDGPYQEVGRQMYEDEMRGRATPETASYLAEDDFGTMSQNTTASRKRKRREEEEAIATATELEHTIYGDELLDYFVTAGDDPALANVFPPVPPTNFNVNRPIDSHGNNALHWACAMGDVHVTRDLLARGANPAAENSLSGETPLMRAVLFTNNFDKKTFPKIVQSLANTIVERDFHAATVFHHIAETSRSKGKWACARYYCEVLVNKMQEMGSNYVQALLRSVDKNGDTAVLCAIRNGCVKVASFLLNHCPEAGDTPNLKGETANEFLRILREKRDSLEQPPSSPPRAGDSLSDRRRSRHSGPKPILSKAASTVMSKFESLSQETSTKLVNMYETEIKDKDNAITDAKQALAEFEAQRHKVRQEMYALMAKAEDDSRVFALREQYADVLKETESLLEQREHATLQLEVRQHDQQTNPQAFRSANPHGLSHEEMNEALPWAIQLNQEHQRRRQLVRDIAGLTGDAGTGERIGKHRKLVAIATGLKEDDLDSMSQELFESLQATQQGNNSEIINVPQTPPRLAAAALEVA